MAGTLTVCCAETAGEGEFAGVCVTCWLSATDATTKISAAEKEIDRQAIALAPLAPHTAESLRLSGSFLHPSEAALRIQRSAASLDFNSFVHGKPKAFRPVLRQRRERECCDNAMVDPFRSSLRFGL